MSKITFKDLPALAESLNMDSELLESFYFSCRVKNLTNATMRCYAERISYLMKYAASIKKGLEEVTARDLQNYVMSIIGEVSAATVNGRIVVYKVFYKHLFEEGLLDENPTVKLKKIKAPPKKNLF